MKRALSILAALAGLLATLSAEAKDPVAPVAKPNVAVGKAPAAGTAPATGAR